MEYEHSHDMQFVFLNTISLERFIMDRTLILNIRTPVQWRQKIISHIHIFRCKKM